MNSEEGHVKRPMNCFMVWSREKRYHILKEHPGINNAEVSKALGAAWRKLSEEDKEPYVEEARRLTEQHKMENPGYKYQPKRRKSKRKRKPDKKIVTPTMHYKKSDTRKSSGEKIHLPFKIMSGPSMSQVDELGERPSVFFPPQLGLPCFPPTLHTGAPHGLCSCHYFYPTPQFYPSWAGGTNERHFYNVGNAACFRPFSVQEQSQTGRKVESMFHHYKM
ncbi:transcription factor SOX-14-like [Oculina patagonica]